MLNSLLFYLDEVPEEVEVKLRLFLGDPREISLTGICVCMTRTNPQRSVTEENVHRVRPLFIKIIVTEMWSDMSFDVII